MPEKKQADAFRQPVLYERPGGLRNKDLSAMARFAEPGGSVHVEANIDLVCRARGAAKGTGMDADAHPDLASARPGVVRQAALAHHRRPDSVRCGFREDGKQRVAATAQDLAACRLESGS